MKVLTGLIFASGIGCGILLAVYGKWDIVEPVIGMATLAVSAVIWLRHKALERKLGDSMEQKKFEITFGLRAGYDGEEADFTLDQARGVIKEWMETRLERNLPILTGMIGDITLIYPVRNNTNDNRVTEEISGQFSGSLSPKYDKGRNDKEIIETLNDLAGFLGKKLCQKRVYVSFAGKQWVIDI
ncbi:MAG: hypothetical protein ABH881_02300 [bacterium]